jgi:anti-anti-sigma regulatory factor
VVAAARTESASVVIDLAGVDYISGAGVTVLREAAGNGTRMILCGLREPVRIALELAQALAGLTVMADRQAAIESLIADS